MESELNVNTSIVDGPGFQISLDGPIATILFNRPPANTIDPELIEALIAALPSVTENREIRCIVISGSGNAFIGGADIRVMRELKPATYRAMRRWIEVQELLEYAPKPVIAALNGHTLGGGAELALACDLRILHKAATFGFPESRLGIFPGAGGSQRLPRLLGIHQAKRMIMNGDRLNAEDALAHGLVDIIADDDFNSVVGAEARRLSELPTATIGLIKQVIVDGQHLPLADALDLEEDAVMANLALEDAAEGLQAFLDKRKAVFTGK